MPNTSNTIEIGEEFLAHHGVLGMKWGNHQMAKAVVLGMYGNKKAYTNAAALKKRTTAGKLRVAAISTAVGGTLMKKLGGNNEYTKLGGGILQSIGAGLGTAAYVNGIQGVDRENQARGIGS